MPVGPHIAFYNAATPAPRWGCCFLADLLFGPLYLNRPGMFPFPKLFLLRIICSPPFGPLLLSHARVTISLTICFQRFFSVLQLVAGHVGSYIEGPARLPLRKPTLHPPGPRSPAPPAWTHIEGPERLSRRFPTPFLSGSRSFARLLPFLCCGFSSANASLCFISAFLLCPGSCSALHGLIYR